MNTNETAAALAGELVRRTAVELEASGRHVHLTREAVEALFGPNHRLTPVKDLSQPGQFACAERVTLVGPKGEVKNVVVLGPERKDCQVEISLTDAITLGVKPPVRLSGDIADTPGILLRHGERELRLNRGLIVAKRHLHLSEEDARTMGVADGQSVRLHTLTARPLTFSGVEVRVSPRFATYAHIDYDEANACGFQRGDMGLLEPFHA